MERGRAPFPVPVLAILVVLGLATCGPRASAQSIACPQVDGPSVFATIVNDSYVSVAGYFSNDSLSTYVASSYSSCHSIARVFSCKASNSDQAVFFMYSGSDSIVVDPLSWKPSNCVLGAGCSGQLVGPLNPTDVSVNVTMASTTCPGCQGVKFYMRSTSVECPGSVGKRVQRLFCPGTRKWACVCRNRFAAEVRSSTGKLLACRLR